MAILKLVIDALNSNLIQGGLSALEITSFLSNLKAKMTDSKKTLESEALYCFDRALYYFCQDFQAEYDATAIWQTLSLDAEKLQTLDLEEYQDRILKKAVDVDILTDCQRKRWYYCIDKVISEEKLSILDTFLRRQHQRQSPFHIPRIFTELAPLPPTRQYIGREEEQEQILIKIHQNKNLVLVNGLGGVGKSTVCKDLFYELKNNRALPLAWVNYNGTDLFKDFVEQFHYPQLRKERQENLKYFLQNEIDRDAIIFVDNLNAREIDDPFIVELAKSNCNVICTSRITDYEHFDTVPISLFDTDKCICLYKKYAGIEDANHSYDDCISKIVERVARHTLTIEILGKISLAESLSPELILAELSAKGIDLSTIVEVQLTEDTLAGHLCKIFPVDKLKKEQKYILHHFSICPFEQIPKEIKDWIDIRGHGTHNLHYLKKYGWFSENEHSFYMHPIIKEVVSRICHGTEEDYTVLIRSLIKLTQYSRSKNTSDRVHYYPYAKAIIEKTADKVYPDIAQLYFNIGVIEEETGNYDSSITHFKMALNKWKEPGMLKYKHADFINTKIANIQVQIGACFYYLDDCENARLWYDKTFMMTGSYRDDELAAQLYNNYALTYQKEYKNADRDNLKTAVLKRRLTKALIYFKKTITEFLKLHKRDMFLAISYRNTASLYMDLKKYYPALFYYEKALEICLKRAEPQNTTLERVYYGLALAFDGLGDTLCSAVGKRVKYKIALGYYRMCHKISVKNTRDKVSMINLDELENKMSLCAAKGELPLLY